MFNQISIIGLGYIGLPTAAVLAKAGKTVFGMDINAERIAQLQQGKVQTQEPQLAEWVQRAVQNQRFLPSQQVQAADAFVIAVPTPLQANFQPNLTAVQQAARQIAPVLQAGNLIILESTVPVGTTEKLAEWLQQARPDLVFPLQQQEKTPNIYIAYCRDRVLPSKICQELVQNHRVIGGLTPQCSQTAVNFYRLFVQGDCLITQARTAELCKLVENSFRDVNIAFANELSLICDTLNIDVWNLIQLANQHPRVQILQPSVGVGGHCIAIDPWFLAASLPDVTPLIQTARQVNQHKPDWVLDKVKARMAELAAEKNCRLSELKVACLGLTFKADVDDVRESPALAITQALADWHQGEVWAVEPNLSQLPKTLSQRVKLTDFSTAVEQADLLVVMVEHQLFRTFRQTSDFSQLSPAQWLDFCGAWRQ